MFKFFKIIKFPIIFFLKKSIELIEKFEYRNLDLNEKDISQKILNTLQSKFKVKTDTGYHPVSEIHITQPYQHIRIETEGGYFLNAADDHILFDRSFNQIFVKDLSIGDFVQTEIGAQRVIDIRKSSFKSSMFDISVDSNHHRFYSNGILSHNTICSSITILHYALFNNGKNILITANKLETAVEIMDKIKEIYQRLPFFLQQGIMNWAQKLMLFENKSRVKGFATTKTASIGNTADFLYLDEFAHLPENIADKFYKSIFPTVSNIDNSKIIITSTPNGYNLFHKLLSDAEKPEGEKSNYTAMRVYWYQVPKRFLTYIRLDKNKLVDFQLSKEEITDYLSQKYPKNKIEIKFIDDISKWVIHVYNNLDCSEEDILAEEIKGIRFLEFSNITTWKKETIRDIGGEEAFNQEYDLRFINSSRSVLTEELIDDMKKNVKDYEWEQVSEMDLKLNFSYQNLKWVQDDDIYDPMMRRKYKILMSVDISEGLGQDYSVINIFKLSPKLQDLIDSQKKSYKKSSDFFKLEQIGIFRSNLVSVKQLAEIFYLLAFEHFDPDNVKVVLEINTYGNEFLAHLPHVFEGNNDYGSGVFLRYKHRADAVEEKIGIKIGENKNLLIKNYQEKMEGRCLSVTNTDAISEIGTFIKHTTSAGNIRYAADGSSKDDIVMTIVSICSVFEKSSFDQFVDEYLENSPELSRQINELMTGLPQNESINYSQILNIRKQNMIMNRINKETGKNINDWMGGRRSF